MLAFAQLYFQWYNNVNSGQFNNDIYNIHSITSTTRVEFASIADVWCCRYCKLLTACWLHLKFLRPSRAGCCALSEHWQPQTRYRKQLATFIWQSTLCFNHIHDCRKIEMKIHFEALHGWVDKVGNFIVAQVDVDAFTEKFFIKRCCRLDKTQRLKRAKLAPLRQRIW